MMWIAYAAVWISMAAAVSTGIYVTGKWTLLWFMIIPLFVSVKSERQKKGEGDDEQDKD